MNRIYCISGLGADERLFMKLRIPGYELVHLKWLPFNNDDTMATYAKKMASGIKDKDPVIIGLSFGGMLAVEIAKSCPSAKVFLISSAKGPSELSLYGGGLSKWLINTMIMPHQLFTTPNFVTLSYLGAHTADEKRLLSQVIKDSDGRFMKWALKAIANWQNNTYPPNVTHIHGTADKTIASANVHPDYWVQGGSHIMVYNKAEEVGEIIANELKKNTL